MASVPVILSRFLILWKSNLLSKVREFHGWEHHWMIAPTNLPALLWAKNVSVWFFFGAKIKDEKFNDLWYAPSAQSSYDDFFKHK